MCVRLLEQGLTPNPESNNQMKYLKAYTLLAFGILIGMGVFQWIELLLTK